MTVKKNLLGIISIILLTLTFILLNSGGEITEINHFFTPFVLAFVSVASAIHSLVRRFFLVTSISMFGIMIFTYLFNMIDVANWFGSLGFGILFVVSFTYLPQIIKKGYIEKF